MNRRGKWNEKKITGRSGAAWVVSEWATVIKPYYVTFVLSLELHWSQGAVRGMQCSHDVRNRKNRLAHQCLRYEIKKKKVIIHFCEHFISFRFRQQRNHIIYLLLISPAVVFQNMFMYNTDCHYSNNLFIRRVFSYKYFFTRLDNKIKI